MKNAPDVIVVGGGVIGCAVAYELAQRSVQVLLLDSSLPGRATSASAGGLWPVGEAVGLGCGVIYHAANQSSFDPAVDGLNQSPVVFREFLVKSNKAFPDLAQRLRQLSGIDIEYDKGGDLLFLMYDEQDAIFVDHCAQAVAPDHQIQAISVTEAHQLEPHVTQDLIGAARLPGEHQVNPMLLAEALKRAAMALGAKFRRDARVTALCRDGNRITGVKLGSEVLTCDTVVNSAGAWSGRLAATADLPLPVFPVRGQVVLTETLPPTLNGCLSTSGCYVLQKTHGEILIGSTTEDAGFDVAVTTEAVTSLCRAAVRAVPMLRGVGIKRVWSGLRPGTPDELPILGPVDGVSGYVNASGGFRTGIVAAPLTGQVVAQCVVGEHSEISLAPFVADRFDQQAMRSLTRAES